MCLECHPVGVGKARPISLEEGHDKESQRHKERYKDIRQGQGDLGAAL